MMFKEATKTFEELANIEGASRLRALRKAMEASFFQDDIPHLIDLIKKADEYGSLDRLESARILHNKGRVFVMQGKQVLGVEKFEKALQVFEEEYSLWDTAWTLIALGSNLPTTGQLEQALAASFRAVALFEELGDSRWLVEAYNMAGLTCVAYFGFWQEGIHFFEKAAEVNQEKKIGDYLRLVQLNAQWAWVNMALGDVKGAVAKSLQALSYSEKTDSGWAKGMAYSNLANYYTVLGNLPLAEEYFGKLMKLPPEVLLNPNLNTPMTTAVFLAGKNQWEESRKIFNAIFAHFKASPSPGVEAIVKKSYAWVLGRQGCAEEAKKQVEEAQKFYREINERFEQVNVQASMMAPANVVGDQVFEVRLDLVNTSRGYGSLIRVENIAPPELKIVESSKDCISRDGSIELKDNRLDPFGVISMKFSLKATKAGDFTLKPRIVYVSDSGLTKIPKTKPVSIHIVSVPQNNEIEKMAQLEQVKIEFKSEASCKVFDFLVKAFKEDYRERRLPQERSGWRTLMDIVRGAGTSKYSIYGSSGSKGQAIADLERQGIVETRVFTGERGRGGKVFKVRVVHEKKL
jgi:tetratricopeptide (TPR) repeat protein